MKSCNSLGLFGLIVLNIPFYCIAHEHHQHLPPHATQNYGYIIKDNNGENITNKILSKRSPYCSNYVGNYFASANDFNLDIENSSYMTITTNQKDCIFVSNGIPNHTYDDAKKGAFPNKVTPQYQIYVVSKNPKQATKPTSLSLRMDNAIMLNGVKVDLLAAGCYGVGDGKIGCFNPDAKWRYNPAYKKIYIYN